MWIPQGWALVGSVLYGGAGIGIGNFDGEWQDDPFYALRTTSIVEFSTAE